MLGTSRTGLSIAWLWLVVAVAVPGIAFADALVVVNVRGANGEAADGRVTLTAEAGGRTYICQTQAGKCEFPNVPGGSYRASVVPTDSTHATPPRAVMIPPAGKVSLIVSTAAGAAAPPAAP